MDLSDSWKEWLQRRFYVSLHKSRHVTRSPQHFTMSVKSSEIVSAGFLGGSVIWIQMRRNPAQTEGSLLWVKSEIDLFISQKLPIRIPQSLIQTLAWILALGLACFESTKTKGNCYSSSLSLYYQVMCPVLLLICENSAHFMKTSMPHHLQFLGILFRYSNQDGLLEQISLKLLLDTEYRQPSKESIIYP